jgi:hypothetical protein
MGQSLKTGEFTTVYRSGRGPAMVIALICGKFGREVLPESCYA